MIEGVRGLKIERSKEKPLPIGFFSEGVLPMSPPGEEVIILARSNPARKGHETSMSNTRVFDNRVDGEGERG
jgi:hypothetical protein